MGKWAKAALDGKPGADPGELIGEREWLHSADKDFSRQKARARYFPGTKGGITRAYNPDLWPFEKRAAEKLAEVDAEEACEVA
jgi:hypothetical protein